MEKSQKHALLFKNFVVKTWPNLEYCSVLESANCEQQYSGQYTVIFATVRAGTSTTQNKATGTIIGHFQILNYGQFVLLAEKKTIVL
jgi:hypothetical protein